MFKFKSILLTVALLITHILAFVPSDANASDACIQLTTNNKFRYPIPVNINFSNTASCLVSEYYDGSNEEDRYAYPKDCDEVLTMGFAGSRGQYTIYPNGANSAKSVECIFYNGGGYTEKPFSLADLDDANNEYLNSNGQPVPPDWASRTKDLIDSGNENLIKYTYSVGTLLTETGGSLIDRYQKRDIPTLPYAMSAKLRVGYFKAGLDYDQLWFRLQYIDFDGNVSTRFDTGYQSRSTIGTSPRTYVADVSISPDTDFVQFYGRCYRTSGSGCQAYISDVSFVINDDLAKEGDTIFYRYKTP